MIKTKQNIIYLKKKHTINKVYIRALLPIKLYYNCFMKLQVDFYFRKAVVTNFLSRVPIKEIDRFKENINRNSLSCTQT